MSKGLVLAAHGSNVNPAVNARIEALVQECGRAFDFDEAVACFHQGEPGFEQVLDSLTASEIVVVPFMSSEGYYVNDVLPKALRQNRRYDDVRIKISRPVGVNPRLPQLVLDRALATVSNHRTDLRFDQDPRVLVAIVGHGTRRNQNSRASVLAVEAYLKSLPDPPWRATAHAFIDDDPTVDELLGIRLADGQAPNLLIIVPMFMGQGPHVVKDLPEMLSLPVTSPVSFPILGDVNGVSIVVDAPLGDWAAMAELVCDGVSEALGVSL
ncbi:MAG: CbiX/SirB N-terminal domain-containing protein [Phycisphaerae bacterium]